MANGDEYVDEHERLAKASDRGKQGDPELRRSGGAGSAETLASGGSDWLRGWPPADPRRSAGERRARAVALRGAGWSVNDIADELGVARSTAFAWVGHLPLDRDTDRARAKRALAQRRAEARWGDYRRQRDARRAAAHAAAAAEVGVLSARELRLIGAVMYWCEGTKAKPWRRAERFTFTNSDLRLLALFLAFVELLGRSRTELTYRLSIHESADAEAATQWWCTALGLPRDRFRQPTVKRHAVRTNRHNTGPDYRGCLVIDVPRGREFYWRVDGWMTGLATAADPAGNRVVPAPEPEELG
ncbi:MAG TPA: helix-turn-helix domain-containing protein [Pilimelia sp.]|nr:helix-turn-helix domain-containing protein [Pilimelia sp.]